jgi:hypothetical protein
MFAVAKRLHCSFCGLPENKVARLAAGPAGLYICDACVAVCQTIMNGEAALPSRFDPDAWPTERLVGLLKPLEETIEGHRAHMNRVVDILRARGMPWSQIAAPLGISRQAAHERFG